MPSVALAHDAHVDIRADGCQEVHCLRDFRIHLHLTSCRLQFKEGHQIVQSPFRPEVAGGLQPLSAHQVLFPRPGPGLPQLRRRFLFVHH